MLPNSERGKYLQRYTALLQERQTWDHTWKQVERYVLPYSSRFLSTDTNKGTRRNDDMVNAEAFFDLRTLQSGMMAGASNPNRVWFILGTADPEFRDYLPARRWFNQCEDTLRLMLARSNVYNSLHAAYGSLGGYGTAAIFIDEDHRTYLRGYDLPIGRYCLATGPDLRVDTMYRETSMTVLQTVRKFGYNRVSRNTRTLYDQGNYDHWVEVIHVIEPRNEHVPGRFGAAGMPYRSLWLEKNADDRDGFLHEGGYRTFPVLAPRWDVIGEDVYGIGPGIAVLGDAKALQQYEYDKAKLVNKTADPPMQGPSSLMGRRRSLRPGDFTPVDVTSAGLKFEPAQIVQPHSIAVVEESIAKHERRIARGLYADLWLLMTGTDRREITAREVAERAEEKMIQLGPVMDRLHSEMLQPLIERTFYIASASGLLPPPPPELQGREIRVEFVSIFAQAAKLVNASSIERTAGFAASLAQADPSVIDVIDLDSMTRKYADAIGAPSEILRDPEVVAQIRQARAQAQAEAQQAEQMQKEAKAVRDLSNSQMGDGNALERLMGASV